MGTLTHDATVVITNPATNDVVGELPQATHDEVGRVLVKASHAQQQWSRQSRHERYDVMVRFADLVADQTPSLARLLSSESGKPMAQSEGEFGICVRLFRGFAARMLAMKGDAHFLDSQAGLEEDVMITRREPLGVVVAILPFNFPVELFAHKVAPALAMGNSVVVKPPLEDPLAVVRLVALLQQAGLPEGVVEVVVGDGDVGAWLVDHEIPAAVSFTGSTESGVHVARSGARTLKRLTLELGSNDAMIILDDADLELALEHAVFGRLLANGQCCCANKRLLVHRAVIDEFTEALVERYGKLAMGDPCDEATELGPLIHAQAAQRVTEQVQATVRSGAQIATGGTISGESYFAPTVLVGVTPQMDIMRDMEVFGPVLPVVPFSDVTEAVAMANSTRYGLSGSVFSRDLSRALRVAADVESGQVVINGTGLYRPDQASFGGYKFSGHGREGLDASLDEYSQNKNIVLRGAMKRTPQLPDSTQASALTAQGF